MSSIFKKLIVYSTVFKVYNFSPLASYLPPIKNDTYWKLKRITFICNYNKSQLNEVS